ncbi:hypothetical protein ACFL6X_08620 [Candidatus Latescibacterota bacterium]
MNEGKNPEDFLRKVWSYNPFWVERGHPEYAIAVVARALDPLDQHDEQ